MGAGIAVQFKRRFLAMYQVYRRRCQQGGLRLGDIFVWDHEPDLVIYNLATQPAPCPSATLQAIDTIPRRRLAFFRTEDPNDRLHRTRGHTGVMQALLGAALVGDPGPVVSAATAPSTATAFPVRIDENE